MHHMTRRLILALSLALTATRLPAQSYVGTWTLVLVDKVSPDGNRTPLYGDNPQGLMTLGADGRYTMQILRAGRPTFASNSKATGTAEENQRAVQGANSHYGRYTIEDQGTRITFHIDHAFFPNWEGTAQKCGLAVTNDSLTILQPTTSSGGGSTGIIIWRRVDTSFTGTWTLVAADEIHGDGTRAQAYGPKPEGQMIVDDAGHYSLFIAGAGKVSAHYGRFDVDLTNHTLTFDIAHATRPELDGVQQKRPFELDGDQLTWRQPPHADGIIPVTVWRRGR
jgi:Lipocalin-like domain